MTSALFSSCIENGWHTHIGDLDETFFWLKIGNSYGGSGYGIVIYWSDGIRPSLPSAVIMMCFLWMFSCRGFVAVPEKLLFVWAGGAAAAEEGQGETGRHAGESSRAADELLSSVCQWQVSTQTHIDMQCIRYGFWSMLGFRYILFMSQPIQNSLHMMNSLHKYNNSPLWIHCFSGYSMFFSL